MAEGRRIGRITLNNDSYIVREHMKGFQPPQYIAERKAISREVKNIDSRVPFYMGRGGHGFRVTFQYNGVWCYLAPYDNVGLPNPQNLLFENLERTFEFAGDKMLDAETQNSPFRRLS